MFDPQEIKQLKELFSESESRMIGKIKESEFRTSLKIDQLSNDLGAFVDNIILPQIAEKADKSDVRRLEQVMDRLDRKFDWIVDKIAEHDTDVKKLKTKVFPN